MQKNEPGREARFCVIDSYEGESKFKCDKQKLIQAAKIYRY